MCPHRCKCPKNKEKRKIISKKVQMKNNTAQNAKNTNPKFFSKRFKCSVFQAKKTPYFVRDDPYSVFNTENSYLVLNTENP